MEALSSLDQTITAISHVSPKRPYKDTVTIIKEHGESRVKIEKEML
jgi:hypothetical protein